VGPDVTEEKALIDQAHVAAYGINNLNVLLKQELKFATRMAKFTFPMTSRKEAWRDMESALKTQRASGDFFDTVGDMREGPSYISMNQL
jgi:hypothetical protein